MKQHEHTVLVLQGGGALGAYQAGVYEGMSERGIAPDWVTGVSIGAVNGALIAGNPTGKRIERLREFWDRVSSGPLLSGMALTGGFEPFDPLRAGLNRFSALAAATFGVPGFFTPRLPPPVFAPDGTPGALSLYDTSPLFDTLNELVDFDLLNAKKSMRLSIGTVQVASGNSVYFDSRDCDIRAEHIVASGSLPPGFPAVTIDGKAYWDGGIVSNSPLWYVLDDREDISALIIQVDLFSARGDLPENLDQVLERAKDIQYSSKTRFNTRRGQDLENMHRALDRLLEKIPPELRADADYRLLQKRIGHKRQIAIAHLINRRFGHSTNSKDYEFSRTTVRQLWQAGLEDVRRTCNHADWAQALIPADGMRTFDLTR